MISGLGDGGSREAVMGPGLRPVLLMPALAAVLSEEWQFWAAQRGPKGTRYQLPGSGRDRRGSGHYLWWTWPLDSRTESPSLHQHEQHTQTHCWDPLGGVTRALPHPRAPRALQAAPTHPLPAGGLTQSSQCPRALGLCSPTHQPGAQLTPAGLAHHTTSAISIRLFLLERFQP